MNFNDFGVLRWCSIGVTSIWNRANLGSGGPGPETAPRGTKSTTFAKGIFQPSDLRNIGPNRDRAKSGSGAPGRKSAPRGSKSTTFAKGIFQVFNFQNSWEDCKLECDFGRQRLQWKDHFRNSTSIDLYVLWSINQMKTIKSNQSTIFNPLTKTLKRSPYIKSNQINQSTNHITSHQIKSIQSIKWNDMKWNQSIHQSNQPFWIPAFQKKHPPPTSLSSLAWSYR